MSLGRTGNVDLIAYGEGFDRYDVADRISRAIVKTEFLEVFLHRKTVLFKMSRLGFCGLLCFCIHKTELYGFVAVLVGSLALCDNAGTCLNHRYRDDVSDFVEDLSHTDLFTDNSFFHFSSCGLLVGVFGFSFRIAPT